MENVTRTQTLPAWPEGTEMGQSARGLIFRNSIGRKWADRAIQLYAYAACQEKGKITVRAELWMQR